MPPAAKPSTRPSAKSGLANASLSNYGQVIEFIPERLYLGAYFEEPTADTPFPFPAQSQSPSKKSSRLANNVAPKAAYKEPFYFTIDEALPYNAFFHDFGPLHVGHLYRFALYFHDILGAKEHKNRPIVLWSNADPRSRANAACLLACYMVLIQKWPPHLALAPIAQVDPPLMPFRDAGYSQADYGLTVQDVVYGVWKAREENCCNLESFSLDEYEMFERVENGDFNWINPNFLAFASPMHEPINRVAEGSEQWAALPKTLEEVDACKTLPDPFKKVLTHFTEKNIGLVVRLNSELYSPSYFEALGINHLDMIFEDGTCPPLKVVRKFIKLSNEVINVRKQGIAVHCKAGLGRTGCLIGAYLIYRHGFTANEVIAYMRFMRPGMVVGPQQHWLHINQGIFREWWVEERVERRLRRELAASAAPSTPIRAMQKANLGRSSQLTSTPPNRSASNRTPLSEVDDRQKGAHEDYLPAPTPGQPRKSGRADRHHPYARSQVSRTTVEEEEVVRETEVITMQRTSNGADSEEELRLRTRTQHMPSASPEASPRQSGRSVSQTTTTSYTYTSYIDNDASHDIENIGASVGRSASKSLQDRDVPSRAPSVSGALPKVRGAAAGGSVKRTIAGKEPAGIRKTSGRVGSHGAAATVAAATAARKMSGL